MKIVILGYTGLVGNDILQYLAKNTSYKIVCIGRNTFSKPYRNPRIKYFKWNFKSFTKSNLFFIKNSNVVINCVGKIQNTDDNLKEINEIFIKNLVSYLNNLKLEIRLIHLSSVSVYGGAKEYLGIKKSIFETSPIRAHNLYSKSKINADLYIKKNINYKNNNKLSYSILRITNIFGGKKESNLFKFVIFSLKIGFWIRCYENTIFNFINVKDVTQAIILIISKLKKSKNKIYIVSNDLYQKQLYKNYQNLYKKKIIKFKVPFIFIKFLVYIPLPKKIVNFILLTSTRVNYSNKKIKKELSFKPKFNLIKI